MHIIWSQSSVVEWLLTLFGVGGLVHTGGGKQSEQMLIVILHGVRPKP